jgi:hypothetical protein
LKSTFVYAWELGGGLGHVSLFKPLADALEAQGHHVVSVVQNVVAARAAGLTQPLQAPKLLVVPKAGIFSHAGILQSNGGFFDASNLLSTVKN